jgi:hypothetical protein
MPTRLWHLVHGALEVCVPAHDDRGLGRGSAEPQAEEAAHGTQGVLRLRRRA